MVLFENSLTDATKGRDPKVLDSLKLAAKEVRRDANQGLEFLVKTTDSIDDMFDCSTRRLKDLEQTAGRSGPRLDSGLISKGEPQNPTEKDMTVISRTPS